MEEQAVNSPVQQSNIPTPPEPKHQTFLTSKLFLITLIVAFLFTMVYAGIYLYLGSQLDKISKPSPTPLPVETSMKEGDPTANWKTYTNTKYGYSIKYPPEPGWRFLTVDPFLEQTPIQHFALKQKPPKGSTHFLTFIMLESIKENSKNESFEDWVTHNIVEPAEQEYRKQGHTEYKANIKRKSIITDGKKIEAISGTRLPGAVDTLLLYILEDNKIIEFSLYPGDIEPYKPDETQIEAQNVIYSMVTAFKFLDQVDQVVCTADAKLCPDGSYVSRQPPNCEFAACP